MMHPDHFDMICIMILAGLAAAAGAQSRLLAVAMQTSWRRAIARWLAPLARGGGARPHPTRWPSFRLGAFASRCISAACRHPARTHGERRSLAPDRAGPSGARAAPTTKPPAPCPRWARHAASGRGPAWPTGSDLKWASSRGMASIT